MGRRRRRRSRGLRERVDVGEQFTDRDEFADRDCSDVAVNDIYAVFLETLEKTQGGLAQCEI